MKVPLTNHLDQHSFGDGYQLLAYSQCLVIDKQTPGAFVSIVLTRFMIKNLAEILKKIFLTEIEHDEHAPDTVEKTIELVSSESKDSRIMFEWQMLQGIMTGQIRCDSCFHELKDNVRKKTYLAGNNAAHFMDIHDIYEFAIAVQKMMLYFFNPDSSTLFAFMRLKSEMVNHPPERLTEFFLNLTTVTEQDWLFAIVMKCLPDTVFPVGATWIKKRRSEFILYVYTHIDLLEASLSLCHVEM